MMESNNLIKGGLACIITLLSLFFIICMCSCNDPRSKDLQYIVTDSSHIDETRVHHIDDNDSIYRKFDKYIVHHKDLGYITTSENVYKCIQLAQKQHIKLALLYINNHGKSHILLD